MFLKIQQCREETNQEAYSDVFMHISLTNILNDKLYISRSVADPGFFKRGGVAMVK